MHSPKPRLAAPAAAAFALLSATAAAVAAPSYHLTDLGPSSPTQINGDGAISGTTQGHPARWYGGAWHFLKGSHHTDVNGIGNNLVAVGTADQGRHREPMAVMWKAQGTQRQLAPDAVESYGTVIRGDGTAYGMLRPQEGDPYPFSWKGGVLTPLPAVAGWTWTQPLGANKTGQVAATAQAVPQGGECPSEPVLFTGGAWVPLGSLGGDCGGASAVNDAGVVVGFTTVDAADAGHAFSWSKGVMTDLGSLGGGYANADDISVDGVIVGYSADAALDPHAVIWRAGKIAALDTLVDQLPDGTMIEAVSINEAGQILVSGVGHDGQLHTYLLDPL